MYRKLAALALVLLPLHANADTCFPMKHLDAKSANGRYVFRMEMDGQWKGRLEDTKSGEVRTGVMAGLGKHLHSTAFVTDDGSRVVLIEPSVPRNDGGVILVYDDTLKLLKGFSYEELLTATDRKATSYTSGHYNPLAFGRKGRVRFGLDEGEKTFSMLLRTKRKAIVSLAEPKIVPTPDAVPEVFEFEEGLPPGKTDMERFQGTWMITGNLEGALGVNSSFLREEPRYYTYEGTKVRDLENQFELGTFRLDESTTPRSIDMFMTGDTEPFRGIYEFRGGKLVIFMPLRSKHPRPTSFDFAGEVGEVSLMTLQRRTPRRK